MDDFENLSDYELTELLAMFQGMDDTLKEMEDNYEGREEN